MEIILCKKGNVCTAQVINVLRSPFNDKSIGSKHLYTSAVRHHYLQTKELCDYTMFQFIAGDINLNLEETHPGSAQFFTSKTEIYTATRDVVRIHIVF